MAFSKWFWDEFPKIMTWLLIPWLIIFFSMALFNPEWMHATLFGSGTVWAFLVMGVCAIGILGNIIPGIPTNAMPLTLGWLAAADSKNLQFYIIVALGSCLMGSIIGYGLGLERGMVNSLNLQESERYGKAYKRVEMHGSKAIFETRFGKSVAILGHANIAAGDQRLPLTSFLFPAALGHLIWLATYGVPAYIVGWLAH